MPPGRESPPGRGIHPWGASLPTQRCQPVPRPCLRRGSQLVRQSSRSPPGMGSAIFSALLAMLALSNAACHPRNNNGELRYCAAPGKRERSLFASRETEARSKGMRGSGRKASPVSHGPIQLGMAPQVLPPCWQLWQGGRKGWNGRVKGGREGCHNTHPALPSLLQGLQLPTALLPPLLHTRDCSSPCHQMPTAGNKRYLWAGLWKRGGRGEGE